MTTQLAKTSGAALSATDEQYFSRTQIDTIKSVLCRGITDPELALFSEVCRKTGLDPFAKQIYPIKRSQWDADLRQSVEKLTIQTGIDGYRLIAERTGKYQGQAPFQWCGEDGKWVDVWTRQEPPVAARATIFREGFVQPLVRVARWGAYVQTKKDGSPVKMWATSGPEQLAKCAEALALRTAFPQELSGIYTSDEMAQVSNEVEATSTVVREAPAKALAVASKPASVPPPAAEPERATFKWKAHTELNGEPLGMGTADELGAYIDMLTAVLDDPKKQKAHAQAAQCIGQAQAELKRRMDEEAGDIGNKLQAAIDQRPGGDAFEGSPGGSWVAGDET